MLFVVLAVLLGLAGMIASAGASGEVSGEEIDAPAPPYSDGSESSYDNGLGSQKAQEYRSASQTAFRDLAPSEAGELFQSTFANQLVLLNSDPARYLSDVNLIAPAGETAATVSDEGNGLLLEAGIPVRTETDDGDLKKVDLSLISHAAGFETDNALADVQIPEEADGAIRLSETGLEISAPLNEAGVDGEMVGDKLVQYSEVLPDTDQLVAPISDGVEIFNQLRSPESPETLRFQLDLDEAAQVALNGAGGADITVDGLVIASVSPPTAVDAQGTPVEVDLQVEGHALVLKVPHRKLDVAYPILVDPAIHENYENSWWFGGGMDSLDNPNVWQYQSNDETQQYLVRSRSCLEAALCSPSTRGLYIRSVRGTLPAGIWGQWYYTVPGTTTYIPSIYPQHSVILNPFFRSNYDTEKNKTCTYNEYPLPYDYSGAFEGGSWPWYEKDRAQFYGNAYMFTQAKGVAFGMNTGSGVNIPCRRHVMLGGYMIRLDDPEKPTLGAPSGIPSGWLKAGQSVAVSVSASDPGLGVQNFHISPEGALPFPYTPEQNQCPGTKPHPCPANTNANFNQSVSAYSQGISTVQVSASDPTGEKSNTQSFQLKVDRTAPTINLSGQLAYATDEDFIASTPQEEAEKDPKKWDELRLPVYNLTVIAKDGSTSTNLTKRSGVKDIEIWVDGAEQSVQWSPQECPTSSCGMTKTYELDLVDDLASGKHTLKVVALDQLGQKEERTIEFEYVPATGISDDDILQRFPLPDGKNHEDELVNKGPELAVNILNGNLVYHELDVDVEGPIADLEVERFYNSQLPANENTEWGDGWTLAQVPEIDPVTGGGAPTEAVVRSATGELVRKVALPTSNGFTKFDPKLQSTVTKKTGGYVVEDEADSAAEAEVFNESGRLEEVEVGKYASIDYSYDSGDLAEIAVDDPASSTVLPEEVEVPAEEGSEPAPTYHSAFGSNGSGEGELRNPADLALGGSGDVWVADTGNDRIQRFNSQGQFLAKFGTAGTANGQLSSPAGVAIDSQGNVWVADTGNDRIQKFTAAGAYSAKFGAAGSGPGQLANPEGIAIDAQGNLWVADTGNGRIQKFSSAGQFLEVVAPQGLGVIEPTGIDMGPSGDMFVTDRAGDRVVIFSPSGGLIRQFGGPGIAYGHLDRPEAIDVDTKGNVWVAEAGNARVQQFDLDGSFVTAFGAAGAEADEFDRPAAVVATADGSLLVLDSSPLPTPIAPPSPPPSSEGPVAAYSFDEGAGDLARDSAGDNHGALHNATWTEAGKVGSAIHFDGEDDWVQVADSAALDFSSAFTLEAWVRPDAHHDWATVFAKGDAGGASSYSYILYGSNHPGQPPKGWLANAQGGEVDVSGSEELPLSAWSHLAMTSDGQQLRLYVDGELVDTATAVTARNTNGPLVIGGNDGWSEYFEGTIDEVRLYDRALGGGQIVEDMGSGVGLAPRPDPVAALSFDEGSGKLVGDSAGRHDGILTGAQWSEVGRFGSALTFDGLDDVVSIPDANSLDFTDSFTVEAWVKPASAQEDAPIIIKESWQYYAYRLDAGGQEQGVAEGRIADADWSWEEVEGKGQLPVGSWSHLALTYGGGALRLYIDGELQEEAKAPPAQVPSRALRIGGNNFGDFFAGAVDEVRLYRDQLSSAEIEEDMDTEIGPAATDPEAEPVAAFAFDEGSGTKVHDYASGNDGTIDGAQWSQAGKFGAALSFDGVDDLLTVPDSDALDFTRSFTLEAWVKPTEANEWSSVMTKERGSSLSYQLSADGSQDAPVGFVDNGEDEAEVNGDSQLPVNQWSHLALVSEGDALRLYLNGQLEAVEEGLVAVRSNGDLQIGGNLVWGEEDAFKGLIDEVRLYDRALDAGELAEDLATTAEPVHNRVQRWTIPPLDAPVYNSSFGTLGSGEGQFNKPADVALDSHGHIWVADQENHRIQHFNPGGEFVSQFGSQGSGNGQLNRPASIAFDSAGNLWVADKSNHRIQKFAPDGTYLAKFGTYGSGAGQFNGPEGIAIDAKGDIWISDTYNYRVQRFNAKGEFIEVVNPAGLGAIEPTGIDAGPGGNVWVADWSHNRIVEFNEAGGLVRYFGSSGSNPLQFNHPDAIEADSNGNVWVGDQGNNRIQRFDQTGGYLGSFGTSGSGAGQFSFGYPFGFAVGSSGRMWIADRFNNRIQRWEPADLNPTGEELPVGDDPSVEIETEGGLVSDVEGAEAGEHSYSYSGDDLVSHDGPEGETKYEYDGNGQLTKVTLPNGTVGSIAYWSDKRVKSVTVDPTGEAAAKTTHFEYSDEPRRTVVVPDDAPAMTYDLGNWEAEQNANGIFRWSNISAGHLADVAGTLFAFKETSAPISIGDHNLEVEARSSQGIASIKFVANGNEVMDEKICEQNFEVPGIECTAVYNEWVVNTSNLPPGILTLEIIVTDRTGKIESVRFWVNVPYTPPPNPDANTPPKFADILSFREEFGLDIDLDPVQDEQELNDRIFNLIGAWHNPGTPAGEVARASWERWGVPLRAVDVAELEYRQRYIEQAATVIPQWAAAHAPTTYAGYYVDHRAGGIIRVGFTSGQEGLVSQLKSEAGLLAPDRVGAFTSVPKYALTSVGALAVDVPEWISGNPSVRALVTRVGIDVKTNRVSVGATNTGAVAGALSAQFGAGAPIDVVFEAHKPHLRIRMRPRDERLFSGDLIAGGKGEEAGYCTLGFGAFESKEKKANGSAEILRFGLTAGHCFAVGDVVSRVSTGEEEFAIGTVRRRSYGGISEGMFADGEAILLKDAFPVPRWVYWSAGAQYHISGSEPSVPGSILCTSGSFGGSDCGFASEPFVAFPAEEPGVWVVQSSAITTEGDSGGPVWNMSTGRAVGLVEGGYESTGPTWFTPLQAVALPDGQTTPGLLSEMDAPGGSGFNIAK